MFRNAEVWNIEIEEEQKMFLSYLLLSLGSQVARNRAQLSDTKVQKAKKYKVKSFSRGLVKKGLREKNGYELNELAKK